MFTTTTAPEASIKVAAAGQAAVFVRTGKRLTSAGAATAPWRALPPSLVPSRRTLLSRPPPIRRHRRA